MNQNLNKALNVTYRMIFDRLPGVAFETVNISLPSVSLAETTQSTPFAPVKRPGTRILYEPLTLTFLVEEDFSNYIAVLDWMTGLASPVSANELAAARQVGQPPLLSDAILSVLDNKYNDVARARFTFSGCWPTSLGGVDYTAQDAATTQLRATATFSYTSFGHS